jgi:hypothetical protein
LSFWGRKKDKVAEMHNQVFNRSSELNKTAEEKLKELRKGKNKIIDVMIENTTQREGTAFIYNVINADNGRFLGTIKANGFLHIAESLNEKSLKDGILYRFKGTIYINCNEYENRTIKEKCKKCK